MEKSDRVVEGQPFIASLGWAVFGERAALSLSGGSGSVLPITPIEIFDGRDPRRGCAHLRFLPLYAISIIYSVTSFGRVLERK